MPEPYRYRRGFCVICGKPAVREAIGAAAIVRPLRHRRCDGLPNPGQPYLVAACGWDPGAA